MWRWVDAMESEASGPGKVLLLSSGETSAPGRRMHKHVLGSLGMPAKVTVLETPAGFELNSAQVAGRVADFMRHSLQDSVHEVHVIPARHRDGPLSTNDPRLLAPVLDATYLFLGAGSPTYLVRHLRDSLAYQYIIGRHRMGAALCLASASAIAFGAKVLPVYEIFKAGHDLHWVDGLDFFGLYGLSLAIVSHWDNREGGEGLDTSRCFMGVPRMAALLRLLPPETVVLGIDEHTGVEVDFRTEQCLVMGKGGTYVLRRGLEEAYSSGDTFPIQKLGPFRPATGLPSFGLPSVKQRQASPPHEVLELVELREAARRDRNWAEADKLRTRVAELGFEVRDTPSGPLLHPLEGA